MPAIVAPARKLIYYIGSQFRAAVSEELIQRMAAVSNFISLYQHSEKQFFINGPYSIVTPPQTALDGLAVFEFNAEIIDVWAFNLVAGSSGTTEIDVKIATTPGGAFTSIFSTTPKITSAAGNNVWVGAPGGAYTPPSGTTAPVLSTVNVNAYSAIRVDILQAQPGGQNAGVILHYRPR
jgi:hypothetical protein